MSLKKFIGKFGRKHGGKPFFIISKNFNKSLKFLSQASEIPYMLFKRYKKGSRDDLYLKENYNKSPVHNLKEGIVCICDGSFYHGGPTDRLRGILTTFREAKRKQIPFYISWTSPFDLEDYLIPATFDWRIKPEDISKSSSQSFPLIIEDVPNILSWLRLKFGLFNKRKQTHVYSNGDNGIGKYAELYKELFKPSTNLQKEVDHHHNHLGNNYWAFTFRFLQLLGDFKDWSQIVLSTSEADALINKVTDELKKLIKDVPNNYKILITSDSITFLNHVRDIDERIYIVPGDVKNIDLLNGEIHEKAWMKTFVDQQLLMKASKVFLLRTGKMYKSGFPRFAAEVGGVEFIDHVF